MSLSAYTKFKSTWIKDIDMDTQTLNLLEEKRSAKKVEDTAIYKDFLNRTTFAQDVISRINIRDYNKNFCMATTTK